MIRGPTDATPNLSLCQQHWSSAHHGGVGEQCLSAALRKKVMSTDLVACPHCGTNLQNSPALAGQVVACPTCQSQLQMPAMAATTHAPGPVLPQPAPTDIPVSVGVDTSARGRPAPKAMDRVRRRSNPLLPVAVTLGVVVLISVGVFGFLFDAARKQKEKATQQLVGNWELVSGQTGHDHGEFAFHTDGKFQVLLQAGGQGEVLDGSWNVDKANGDTAQVSINWPDSSSETMTIRLSGGQLHVELPSVGQLTFRAAGPNSQL